MGLHGRYGGNLFFGSVCLALERTLLAAGELDGHFIALIAGLTALLGLSPVQKAVGIDIPSARVGLISIAVTVLAMVVGSFLFPDRRPKAMADIR